MANTIMIKPAAANITYVDGIEVSHGTQHEYDLCYSSGVEKPTEGVRHGDLLYYFDWYDLTEEQKKACKAQVWMFDADARLWRPQTKPYEGS